MSRARMMRRAKKKLRQRIRNRIARAFGVPRRFLGRPQEYLDEFFCMDLADCVFLNRVGRY